MKARALWCVAPGVAELREEVLPPPAEGQALVRMLASGISRGTERLVLAGRVPESQWPVMRAPLMAGAFPFPVKYGYAAVGGVEAGPPALLGRRVFCLHPHQDRFLAPAAMCVPVPEAVPDLQGKPVLILSGLMDPIVPKEHPVQLEKIFSKAGANIRLIVKPAGHNLVQSDLKDMQEWMQSRTG